MIDGSLKMVAGMYAACGWAVEMIKMEVWSRGVVLLETCRKVGTCSGPLREQRFERYLWRLLS